jgi:hypothetical protein
MKSQQLGRSSGLRRTLLAAFATLWTATGGTWAVSAWPGFHHETQPDGTQVEVRLCGDEHRHWQEDARASPSSAIGDGMSMPKKRRTVA